jgi:hypothetical protein
MSPYRVQLIFLAFRAMSNSSVVASSLKHIGAMHMWLGSSHAGSPATLDILDRQSSGIVVEGGGADSLV